MSLKSFIFGKDPRHEANKYLNQIPGMLNQTYQPYIQQGQGMDSELQQRYSQLANDPAAFYDQLMSKYQPSRAYEMKNQAQQNAAQNAAAAGGMRGTQANISESAQIADRLMGDDMREFYQNMLGLTSAGMQGQQGISDRGWQAAQGYGQDMSNYYGQQGGLAYQNQRDKNQQRNQIMQMLFGAGAFAAGLPTQGGGSVGGDFLKGLTAGGGGVA